MSIHEVFYVPHLTINLISIGQLLQNKYDVRFHDTYCAIYDKPPSKRLISKVEMTKNRIFPLSLRSANLPHPVANTVSHQDESWLWHCRFGHLPFKSLNLLHKQSMVKGLNWLFINNPTHVRIVSLVNIKGTVSPLPPLEPKNILR